MLEVFLVVLVVGLAFTVCVCIQRGREVRRCAAGWHEESKKRAHAEDRRDRLQDAVDTISWHRGTDADMKGVAKFVAREARPSNK